MVFLHLQQFFLPKNVIVELVTAEGKRLVKTSVNVEFEATGVIDPNAEGFILVPGGAGDMYGDGPNLIYGHDFKKT
ncbi:hypothetical protein JFL43_10750 [Viridibacillus sp. YIM B01967]|uniref:DJ-1/PfpI domain-containing protein n=1 Tax=Viridibacillus soli TaxID=2798301 RepID=A0ABS1H7C3_9BACL|nr:hypothetical protein [Viridibacillus soli]MBK3495320.1 hypothetical protein [Viridibacillus soli]